MEIPDDLISPKQAAKICGCHAVTVYRWIHYGIIPAYKRGRSRFLVSKKDLDHVIVKYEPLPEIEIRDPRREELAIASILGNDTPEGNAAWNRLMGMKEFPSAGGKAKEAKEKKKPKKGSAADN